ncbi:hypothetical protein NRIC_17240 [Enterococcus florum]|uniref:HTH araC/xylS-type domain-containing protein n=1 Tax=Enterococcus florum TaxID=2480627 RepID=A0A4P5PKG4_9ENTE|nr:AraC family transcriptional regulator [Enterococcus florum]GCF93833.1 hypothetical protein NRIC_17240 [Enterococcus florum]
MVERGIRCTQFSKSLDYSEGLSQLNYRYTINGSKEPGCVFRIYQMDQMVLTHSIVDRSQGMFTRSSQDHTNYLGLRFIKTGRETHANQQERCVLTDYTIGIFDLRMTSSYEREERTEGINLFIRRNGQTEELLPLPLTSKILEAERGMGRMLLEMIFQITEQFPYCTEAENRLLLQRFIQLFCEWTSQTAPFLTRETHNELLVTATDYMRANLWDAELSIEQTASYCQTSIRTLQKVFQKAELSFSHYLNDLRITAAAIKLYQTSQPITSIAFQCGYNHSAYFSKRFKEKYRLSPMDYRKKMQDLLKLETLGERDCPLLLKKVL